MEEIILLEYHVDEKGRGMIHYNYWNHNRKRFQSEVNTWGWHPVGILKPGVDGSPDYEHELERLLKENADIVEFRSRMEKFVNPLPRNWR